VGESGFFSGGQHRHAAAEKNIHNYWDVTIELPEVIEMGEIWYKKICYHTSLFCIRHLMKMALTYTCLERHVGEFCQNLGKLVQEILQKWTFEYTVSCDFASEKPSF